MKWTLTIIPELALKDLKHEFILSLCLVVAISSVIAPLLILLGLKNGTIYTLKKRLIDDPSFREIRPVETREYPESWFNLLKKDSRVGFLIPTILPASSTVYIKANNKKGFILVDIVPTGKGDPLLLSSNIPTPKADQCVLSFGAARDFNLKKGQRVKIKVSRYKNGRYEYGISTLEVIGILPKQYGILPKIYAPLQLLLDIESFKEGKAVPKRGWKGSFPKPYKRFDGILAISNFPFDPILQNSLLIEGALAKIEELSPDEFEKKFAIKLEKKWHIYLLTIPGVGVPPASIRALKNRLRGLGVALVPFTNPIKLKINNRTVKVIGLSPDKKIEKIFKNLRFPWLPFDEKRGVKDTLKILLSPDGFIPSVGKEVLVHFSGANEFDFPVEIVGLSNSRFSYAPVGLTSVLKTGLKQKISFDKKTGSFLLLQSGFRGFRLYAKSIDDVEYLYNKLKAQGINVVAKLEAIQRIKTLDKGLTRLFGLVAILGIIGAICVLTASIYGSVERKRGQLAVLRLLGLSKKDLFFFPIFEGVFIAIAACFLAILGYGLISTLINNIFKAEIRAGESICNLPNMFLLWTTVITIFISALSSLLGAWKTSNIDPAEALREE